MGSGDPVPGNAPIKNVPAAEYVRMSTDQQQYSTENQRSAIQEYARSHGMAVVRTYEDASRSGVSLNRRVALKALLSDVQAGNAGFKAILVYDVSRWGRFQDADESAYYEYVCKRAGIAVHYCAEGFTNDASPGSAVIKSLKRAMAGEYSRELSAKVFAGQCRMVERGYHQGGFAGYGLSRMLQDAHANPRGLLTRGQQKAIQSDRVILVPGPAEEVATVQRIYGLFVNEQLQEREIAKLLNSEHSVTDLGHPWSGRQIRRVLTNPRYKGANVFNRASFKLQQQRVVNPPEMWVVAEHAFTPIVDAETYACAQAIIAERELRLTSDEMLKRLAIVLARRGTLSAQIVDDAPELPSASVYVKRFGSIRRAYQLIGHEPEDNGQRLAIRRGLHVLKTDILERICSSIRSAGGSVVCDPEHATLHVNNEFRARLVLTQCGHSVSGSHRWVVQIRTAQTPDLTIAARIAPDHSTVMDYFMFPTITIESAVVTLVDCDRLPKGVYRFENLDCFVDLMRRVPLPEPICKRTKMSQ